MYVQRTTYNRGQSHAHHHRGGLTPLSLPAERRVFASFFPFPSFYFFPRHSERSEESIPYRHSEPFMGEESHIDPSVILFPQDDKRGVSFCR